LHADPQAGFEQDSKGPLGQYLDEIRKVGLNLDDEFENIAVNGLKSLNDGLTDAIMNSQNLGDVFKNVAKQIVADLIRIAIQQTIVNSLLGAVSGLFGGVVGGGTSALKGSAKISNRASGGPVEAGRLYRINESGVEGFVPAMSGTIIPAGEMNARAAQAGARGASGKITIEVVEADGFATRVGEIATEADVEFYRVTLPNTVNTAAQEAMRRSSRPTLGRSI
jgi:hypothetical protein